MSDKSVIDILNIPHRFFIENITHTTLVKFSTYIVPVGLVLKTCIDLNVCENKFIMCPIYSKKLKGKEVVSDIQIGVTGKAKFKEPQLMAVNREIGEELGMVLPYEHISYIHCIDPPGKTMFWIDAKDVVSSDIQIEHSIDTPWKNAKDNKDKRVCVCVIADLQNATRLLGSPNFNHRYIDGEKDIVGVCAVPVSDAMNYIMNQQKHTLATKIKNDL